MNKQLVFSKDGTLYLNTVLSQSAFAKSRMAERLSEEGLYAKKTENGWTFSSWTFSDSILGSDINLSEADSLLSDNEHVFLRCRAFDGLSLKNYFDMDYSKKLDESEKAKVALASSLVCTLIEDAIKEDKKVPQNGAGGIFISNAFDEAIFLPDGLYRNASSCAGEESESEYRGLYINESLSFPQREKFMQAVIIYRALAGSFPFSSLNKKQREEDIRDGNFTPLKNKVWALSPALSDFVDSALASSSAQSGYATKILKEGSEKSKNTNLSSPCPLSILYKELGLTEEGEIPKGGTLFSVIRKSDISQEQFEEANKKQETSQKRAVFIHRWLRKNQTGLIIAACVILFASVVAGAAAKSYSEAPTTKGLNSIETIEVFYSALNMLDSSTAQNCIKGKEPKGIVDVITNIFVVSKSRTAYNHKEELVSPAEWLVFNYEGNYNIYGLTEFNVKYEKRDLFTAAPANKNHKPIIKEEWGEEIKDKKTKVYDVSYYVMRNETKEDLIIEEFLDRVTLTYNKNRWVITGLLHNMTSSETYSFASFIKDYSASLSLHSNDILLSLEPLREYYTGLPTDTEVLSAQKHLESKRQF